MNQPQMKANLAGLDLVAVESSVTGRASSCFTTNTSAIDVAEEQDEEVEGRGNLDRQSALQ